MMPTSGADREQDTYRQEVRPEGLPAYLSLLRRNRDFRRLYAAQLISFAGDWFLTVPLFDLVLEMTGSVTLAGLMVVCQSLPIFLITPWAGAAIDRRNRKHLMIWVDVGRSLIALLPLLAYTPARLPFAYLSVIAISVGAAYFDPASNAALPNIVRKEELGPANVLMASTWGTMLAVAAGLGGLTAAHLGREVAFILNSLSFLVSALLLKSIRAPFSEVRPATARPGLAETMRETFAYARTHPRVLALLTAKGGFGIGAGVIVMLSLFGRNVFAAGAAGIGLLYATRGLGALLGPFVVRAVVSNDLAQYRLIGICGFIFALGYVGLAFSPSLLVGSLAVLFAHVGAGGQWTTSTYGLQRETPDYVRGRVFAVDYGLVTLTVSASSLLSGVIADKVGPVATTLGAAAVSILWGIVWSVLTYKLWRPGTSKV